jgi:NADPH-dependent curcumin reductase CurA
MNELLNQQWLLINRPNGRLQRSDFEWHEEPVAPLAAGDVLVRTIYLSLDPTNRGWANASDTYLPAIELGSVMRGNALGIVTESNNTRYKAGDFVQGMFGWQLYFVSTGGRRLTKLPPLPGMPLSAHFGLFGHIGLTAYFGLLDITNPQPGETLVVSAAAGAVGSLVGQIGKIKGCRVVGIAGSDEKCRWLTEDLGFDAAINYKTEHVRRALRQHCPDGIDIYFENVGGEILDAVLAQINIGARISLCGLIAQYNATKPVPGPYNLGNLIVKRAKIQGFLVLDYADRAMEALTALAQWYGEGKIQYRVHEVEGLGNAPDALNMLFDGKNQGKLVLKVSNEAI